MIVRLIGTMIVLVLIAFFAGFNLDNKCSVNLLVHEFENVPVFFTIIISFVAGILFSLPFALIHRSSKQKNNESAKPSVKEPKKVRSFFFKKKNVDEKKMKCHIQSLWNPQKHKMKKVISPLKLLKKRVKAIKRLFWKRTQSKYEKSCSICPIDVLFYFSFFAGAHRPRNQQCCDRKEKSY